MRGDVTKLPKWAQQEISRLERDLKTRVMTVGRI
jgi:hypothetical protein